MLNPVEGAIKCPPQVLRPPQILSSRCKSTSLRTSSWPESVEQVSRVNRPEVSRGNPSRIIGYERNSRSASRHPDQLYDWIWSSYSIGVGAGAAHILLADLNHDGKKWLMCCELLFFFFNVISFFLNTGFLTKLYIQHTARLRRLFGDPEKGLLVSFILINLTTVLVGSFRYGTLSGWIEWRGALSLYQLHIVLSFSILAPQWLNWFRKPHSLDELPSSFYLLPMPVLLLGNLSVHLLNVMPLQAQSALNVLLLGYLLGGLGFAMMVYYLTIYSLRILLHSHGSGSQSISSFLVAGIPGFSAHTLMGLGKLSRIIFIDSPNILLTENLGEAWYGAGLLIGLLLSGVSLGLLLIAMINTWWRKTKRRKPNSELWIMSTACTSWGISSALNLIHETFGSKLIHLIKVGLSILAIFSYLVALISKIISGLIKIFKKQNSTEGLNNHSEAYPERGLNSDQFLPWITPASDEPCYNVELQTFSNNTRQPEQDPQSNPTHQAEKKSLHYKKSHASICSGTTLY